jgi:hypothetical protein
LVWLPQFTAGGERCADARNYIGGFRVKPRRRGVSIFPKCCRFATGASASINGSIEATHFGSQCHPSSAEKHPPFAMVSREFDRHGRKHSKTRGASMASLDFGGGLKKPFLVAAMLTATLPLVGCYTPGERAAGGAMIGGLGGAGIGALASGGLAGPILAYSAVGAATGAVIGAATAPVPRYYYVRRCVRRHRRYC